MKNCKGCYSKDSPFSCHPKFRNRSDECPCGICLIKGVCDRSCEDHEAFVSESRGNPIVARYTKRGTYGE